MRHHLLLISLVLLSLTSINAQDQALRITPSRTNVPVLERPLPPDAPVIEVQRNTWTRFNTVEIGGRTEVEIPIRGSETVTLDVERYTVMDAKSRLMAMTDQGPKPIPLPESVLLKGTVRGYPGSYATLALYPGLALGRIDLGNGTTYVLSPLTVSLPTSVAIVPVSSLIEPEHVPCAVVDEGSPDVGRRTKDDADVQAAVLRRVTLALEGDTPYYLDHGSNLTVATAYAEAVIAASSAIYERDVEAQLYIGQLLIWTTTDPYPGTNSTNLLTQFRDYWRTNHTGVNRAVAVLLSGQNGIGGVAYLNSLCSQQWGYAVAGLNNNVTYPRTGYVWDTDVTCHELGHNIGSPHTHSCSWNPPIDSCYTAEGTCFTGTKAVLGTIMSYCHLTPSGTQLVFHPRVVQLMQTRLAAAACVPLVTVFSVNAGRDTTICNGSSAQLQATINGGTAPYTISWTPTTGMSGATTLTPTIQPVATTAYIIEVRDASNTTVRDTVIVSVNPRVTPTVPTSHVVCEGASLVFNLTSLGGTAPYTVRWASGEIDTTTSTPSFAYTPTLSGALSIIVRDSKGCVGQVSTNVIVRPRPTVTISAPIERVCSGSTINISADATGGTAPYTYTWKRNGFQRTDLGAQFSEVIDTNTTYEVIVADANGCTDTAQVLVRAYDLRATIEPSKITLPKISLCEREFDAWITVVNTGGDTIQFSRFSEGAITATSRDLPATIQPRGSRVLAVRLRLPGNQRVVDDTVYLIDATCNTSYAIHVEGDRGEVVTTGGLAVNSYEKTLVCDVPQQRTVTLEIANHTPAGITITGIASKLGKKTLNLSGGSYTIASKATKQVSASGLFAFPTGISVDTVVVSYTSAGCEGTFTAIAAIPTTSVSVTQPKQVIFDSSVSPALEDVEQTINLNINVEDVASVHVTDVDILGPFRTSLTTGMILPTNRNVPIVVAFRPSLLDKDGQAGGYLVYGLESCISADTIILAATRTVVSVDEESTSDTRVVVPYRDRVLIRVGPADVSLIDLNGRVVHSTSVADTEMIDLSSVPPGIYLITVITQQGEITRQSYLRH